LIPCQNLLKQKNVGDFVMDLKALALTMVSLIVLLSAFAYAYFNPTITIFAELPFTVMIIGYFLCGIAFFGYFAFLPAIFLGLQLGTEKNAALFLYILPTIIATYAGTKLGFALQEDFNKKNNFMTVGKKILILFIIAIILALAIELTLPSIVEYWPKDFLGLNVVEGKNFAGIIGDVSKLMRR